jgi:hypothetical protein
MLSKFIVTFYLTFLEIGLWILLIFGVVGGWYSSGVMGSIAGLVIAILIGVTFFGAFLILGDIRQSLRTIERSKVGNA